MRGKCLFLDFSFYHIAMFHRAVTKQGVWWSQFLWSCFLHRVAVKNLNDPVSILRLLKSSTDLRQLNQIYVQVLVNGLDQDNLLIAKLITNLMAIGYQGHACLVFNQVDHPNGSLWTSMIRGYSCNGHFTEAVVFCNRMRHQGIRPNNFTFPFVLKACSNLELLAEGEQIHADIVKLGFGSDVFAQTALVDMYAKCNRIRTARLVFDNMSERSVVSWTAIVAGYCKHGLLEMARELFDEMPERNIVTWNAMIDGLARFGNLEAARELFDTMPQRNTVSWTAMIGGYSKAGDMLSARLLFDQMVEREVVVWTAMICGYAQSGEPGEAFNLFREMQASGIEPDEITMLGVIHAGGQSRSLHLCEQIDSYINRDGYGSSVRILNALIIMYVHCGSIDRAFRVFENIPKKDVVSYNSMITGCATHGDIDSALAVFSSMMLDPEVAPTGITFIGILTACAHSGFVNEGRRYFHLMLDLGYVKPLMEHYACMVDLLGRAGHLDEAHELILSMPIEPQASAWGALLGACRIHGEIGLAEVAAKRLFEMEPDNSGNYTILANMCAEAGMWDAAVRVRMMMREREVFKTAGSSWVEVSNPT